MSDAPDTAVRAVVKVGGSLFTLGDLADRLHRWLAAQPPGRYVLIAGGGAAVDAIRQQHLVRPLAEPVAHWLCIKRMSASTALLRGRLGDCPITHDWRMLANGSAFDTGDSPHEAIVFDSGPFLREQEPNLPGVRLPASWDVTSDSIAARLAVVLGAGELVLMKSAPPPSGDLEELAAVGYVDRFMPRLAGELPVFRAVDLRAAEWAVHPGAVPRG